MYYVYSYIDPFMSKTRRRNSKLKSTNVNDLRKETLINNDNTFTKVDF